MWGSPCIVHSIRAGTGVGVPGILVGSLVGALVGLLVRLGLGGRVIHTGAPVALGAILTGGLGAGGGCDAPGGVGNGAGGG